MTEDAGCDVVTLAVKLIERYDAASNKRAQVEALYLMPAVLNGLLHEIENVRLERDDELITERRRADAAEDEARRLSEQNDQGCDVAPITDWGPHDTTQRIVDGCIIAVAEYTTDELREIARESDERSNGESWLGRMIHEYIETWRQ